MKLVIIGAPGSGKGTQAKLLSKRYNLKHISTGDLLREETSKNTALGNKIKKIISKGDFVSDDLMWQILEPHLKKDFILDGYPRNLSQIPRIDNKIDFVLYLDVDYNKCAERILSRKENRSDDNEDVIKHRIHVYEKETFPIINHFKKNEKLVVIDGNVDVDSIFNNIKKKMHELVQIE
ncbi:hypothetical protein EDEG_02153 [Edhazardia aedis USNM 41457]|uniref:Adenylate kinase active site lid domain-containing protein n=1 Tax=Edhazardia aedis (strain USNM 41457) TaxID=1003232 RepID=J9DQB9_EDHAE|nr:hypothetical protein EDEG_02153 [Edhazardia aedis USNM 41457]|eukprot:EJW03532.1 hypothetical protein EDEG_02153 [Edhazardia aedis USNM 41457]